MKEEPQKDTRRFTAHEILQAALENAREELSRSVMKLTFSGVAGGLTMGVTGLAVASCRTLIRPGDLSNFIPYFTYPIGFIAVIIGRAQLFTENTLLPCRSRTRRTPSVRKDAPSLDYSFPRQYLRSLDICASGRQNSSSEY